ncbi:MAG TPA: hypothetical protein VJ995_06020 [Geothermobacteraceae bacterium]|nr:hypothetical protein [Geothermobacteraceae bacterium]
MDSKVTAVIQKTSVLKDRLRHLVTSYEYPTDKKSQTLVAYHSILAEHHSAIFLLIQNDLCGSAFALARPVYEILYRAHWVAACADEKQIEGIFEDKDIFPKMHDLVSQIDSAFNTGDFWRTIKKNSWSPMNDYTHSGIRQIGRRFKDNQVNQNYETGEILELLNGSNIALLLIANLFFSFFKKEYACSEVQEIILNYNK